MPVDISCVMKCIYTYDDGFENKQEQITCNTAILFFYHSLPRKGFGTGIFADILPLRKTNVIH